MHFVFRVALVTVALFAARAAHAADRPGFVLQPTLGIGTAISPGDNTTQKVEPSTVGFALVPGLRFGVHLRPVEIMASVSYSSAGTSGVFLNGLTRITALAEPNIWRSEDERVSLYVLVGAGVEISQRATTVGTQVQGVDAEGAIIQIGIGGKYALHPNFAIGLELSATPEFFPLDGDKLFVRSDVLVSVTGTFTTGKRAWRPRTD
jgi:hypothetical protein